MKFLSLLFFFTFEKIEINNVNILYIYKYIINNYINIYSISNLIQSKKLDIISINDPSFNNFLNNIFY